MNPGHDKLTSQAPRLYEALRDGCAAIRSQYNFGTDAEHELTPRSDRVHKAVLRAERAVGLVSPGDTFRNWHLVAHDLHEAAIEFRKATSTWTAMNRDLQTAHMRIQRAMIQAGQAA